MYRLDQVSAYGSLVAPTLCMHDQVRVDMDLIHLTMQQPFYKEQKVHTSSVFVLLYALHVQTLLINVFRMGRHSSSLRHGQAFLITTSWADISHYYVMGRHSSLLRHGQTFLINTSWADIPHHYVMGRHSSLLRHVQTFLITTSWADIPHHYVMYRHSSLLRHGQIFLIRTAIKHVTHTHLNTSCMDRRT